MSALGQKQDMCSANRHVRFTPNSDRESGLPQPVMSALPPKADMCGALAHVCFGPIADSCSAARVSLFDHFVRDGHYPWRQLDAEHSGRLKVDDELEFGRLQHWQVGGFGPFKDAAGIDADLTKSVPEVGAVAHQPTGCHISSLGISRRNPVTRRQGGKLYGAANEKCVAADEEGIGALPRKCGKGLIDLSDRTGIEDLKLQPEGRGGFLRASHCAVRCAIGRID